MLIAKQAIIAVLLGASVTMAFMALIAWRRRGVGRLAAVYLALCMLGMAIYNLGYALELTHTTLPDVMFWVRFQHWGIQVIAPTWLLFALCITGKERLITPLRAVMLCSPALLFFLAAQTLGGANLLHANPRLTVHGPFVTFTYDRTLIAWLNVIYVVMCLVLGAVLFLRMLLRSGPTLRKQAATFVGGSAIAGVALALYSFGLTPYKLDFSSLSLSVAALLMALGFLRFSSTCARGHWCWISAIAL